MRLAVCLYLLSAIPAVGQNVWIQTGIRDTILSIDKGGEFLWIATENAGIKTFDPATGAVNTYDNTNSAIQTADFRVIRCAFGKVFAGSYLDGLYVFADGNWIHYDTSNSGLPGNTIRDLCVVPEDSSIWLATDGGLTHFMHNSWVVFDSISDNIQGTHINCLHRSSDGTLWIGTRYNGITKWKDGVAENFNYLNSGINDNFIRDIAEDANGMLYVANNVGINTYDPETDYWLFVYTLYTAPLSSDKINQMGFDNAETFWMVTHHGITRADSANVWTQFYDYNSALPHNTADALYLDPNGRVYAGTYGGLAFYDAEADLPELENNLLIYPNPASDEILVQAQYTVGNEIYLTISDIQGKTVFQAPLSGYVFGACTYSIPIVSLSTGIYHVTLLDGAKRSSAKFLKL